jgi:RHS repeat-associated protein
MEYYPSGLQLCNNTTDSDKQMRRYNGKELDRMHGLNTYDYGARQYNPVTARWDRMDPLCEKYYGVSPYAYCGNNPMNRIDPDGRDVVIVGPLANMALLQLQERIGNDVKLFLTNDNYLCYDIVGKGNLNKSSQTLIEIIDNSDITVNITTTDKKETSSGALLVGGAFMGTNVELDANGNVVHTTAYQEVNPQVLNEADKYSSKGTFMMHELTEAYEGAKISAKKKISSPNSKGDNSVYSEAHKNATTQPAVYQRLFDKDGEQTKNPKEAQKVEWYVKPYSS